MTTERELLELAAKAEGRQLKYMTQILADGSREEFVACWHPGKNSAHGAELEAALSLDVEWWPGGVAVRTFDIEPCAEWFSSHGGDKQAARRWATLRAAAEVGRRAK